MTAHTNEGIVYQAVESFSAEIGGRRYDVRKGELVREGHPLLLGHEHSFQPMRVNYEYEQATNAPGERRTR